MPEFFDKIKAGECTHEKPYMGFMSAQILRSFVCLKVGVIPALQKATYTNGVCLTTTCWRSTEGSLVWLVFTLM